MGLLRTVVAVGLVLPGFVRAFAPPIRPSVVPPPLASPAPSPDSCNVCSTSSTVDVPANQDYEASTLRIDTYHHLRQTLTPAHLAVFDVAIRTNYTTDKCPYVWKKKAIGKTAEMQELIGWPFFTWFPYVVPSALGFYNSSIGRDPHFAFASGDCSTGGAAAVNTLLEEGYIAEGDPESYPLGTISQNFSPDMFEFYGNDKIFVPIGNSPFTFQHDVSQIHHETTRPERMLAAYQVVDDDTVDFLLHKDGGARGTVRVVGDKLWSCGVHLRNYDWTDAGLGCARFALTPGAGLESDVQLPERFVKVRFADVLPALLPDGQMRDDVLYQFGAASVRDFIVDESGTHAYILSDVAMTRVDVTSDEVMPSLWGGNTHLFRMDLETGETVLTRDVDELSPAQTQHAEAHNVTVARASRTARAVFDGIGNIHVQWRGTTGGTTTVHALVKWPLMFQNLDYPSGVVYFPDEQPENGAVAVHFYSMHHIALANGRIYLSGGYRMHYIDPSYQLWTEGAVGSIAWRDEENPLDGQEGTWEGGVVAADDGNVYFSWKRSHFGVFGWDGSRNIMPEGPSWYEQGSFTRDKTYAIVRVDPVTNAITKVIDIQREDWAICYYATVSPDARMAFSACGITGPHAQHQHWYGRGLYSINKFLVADQERATYVTSQTADGIESRRNTTFGSRSLKISPEGIHMEGPGGTTNVKIDTVNHAVLQLTRNDKTTLVGANLANMGSPEYLPENRGAPYEQNVLVGSDSGNIRGGMRRNILIGTNLRNSHPNPFAGPEVTLGTGPLSTSIPSDEPVTGMFAIGHDDDPLIHGNFDTGTLNLPQLHSLEDTRERVAQNAAASDENVLFVNKNIVQTTNGGVHIDGVQILLDEISLLKNEVCLLKGGTAAECTPVNTRFQLNVTEDMFEWSAEVVWSFQKWSGSEWATWASYSGETETLSIRVFDVALDFVDEDQEIRAIEGIITNGRYRVVLEDTWGDGWGTQSGEPAQATITVDGVTRTVVQFSVVNYDVTPNVCLHEDIPCGYIATGEFNIPFDEEDDVATNGTIANGTTIS